MVIEKITEVTDELMAAFRRLVPQLSSSNPAPTREQLAEMVGLPGHYASGGPRAGCRG